MTLMPRSAVALSAAVVLLGTLLAGCAADPVAPATSAAPVADETPTPTPTQAPETGETVPLRVFDAHCDEVFDAADLTGIMGNAVTLRDSPGTAYELSQAGGINCIWRNDDYSALANFDLLPAASLSPTDESAECQESEEENPGFWRCDVEHATNGIRISGFFLFPGAESTSAANAAVADVVSLFDESATPAQAAPVPIPAADAWTNPVDCEGLADAIDIAAIFNDTPGLDYYVGGTDAPPSPARVELWGDTFGLSCGWGTPEELTKNQLASGMTQSFSVFVLGGGAWAQDEEAEREGAVDIELGDFDRVIRSRVGTGETGYEGGYRYSIIDGPNFLQVFTPSTKLGNYETAIIEVADHLNGN